SVLAINTASCPYADKPLLIDSPACTTLKPWRIQYDDAPWIATKNIRLYPLCFAEASTVLSMCFAAPTLRTVGVTAISWMHKLSALGGTGYSAPSRSGISPNTHGKDTK